MINLSVTEPAYRLDIYALKHESILDLDRLSSSGAESSHEFLVSTCRADESATSEKGKGESNLIDEQHQETKAR
jgi:hypothetical protein